MEQATGRIDSAGRVVIPAAFRKKLGLNPGDEVAVVLEGSTLRVMSTAEAVRRAQAVVRRYAGEKRVLSEELRQERRRESKRDR